MRLSYLEVVRLFVDLPRTGPDGDQAGDYPHLMTKRLQISVIAPSGVRTTTSPRPPKARQSLSPGSRAI